MSDTRTPQPVTWPEVAEYVAAGNLVSMTVDDFADVAFDVLYGNGTIEVEVWIRGVGCRYLDIRRLNHHEPGAGIIYEAYTHDSSPLLDQMAACALDSRAGNLMPSDAGSVRPHHLEIVGEVSLNAICDRFELSMTRNA